MNLHHLIPVSGTQTNTKFTGLAYLHSQPCNCLHSYGIKGTLNPHSTPLGNEPVPQGLKQVVNLSCYSTYLYCCHFGQVPQPRLELTRTPAQPALLTFLVLKVLLSPHTKINCIVSLLSHFNFLSPFLHYLSAYCNPYGLGFANWRAQ